MRVPLNDSGRQVTAVRNEIDAAVATVLDSGRFVSGPHCMAFEAEFARYCGAAHCVGVGSGTDALEMALRTLDCTAGDEVITVANAGMYATVACLLVGATPVFADIDSGTLEIDCETLEGVVSRNTRAIVATHLYGKLADMNTIMDFAESRRIPVIEDCAQAHGATRCGRRAGSFGDLATFSFYPTKNLGALGDGGAVVTSHDDLEPRLRALCQYGWESKYHATIPGGRNTRLDEVQAAILRAKLPYLDAWNERRSQIVSAYADAARGTRLRIVHESAPDFVAHLCVGRHPERDAFRRELACAGIDTAIHFPTPDHRQPALADTAWRAGSLAVTEAMAGEIVSLPCFPDLTDDEVDYVCQVIGGVS